MAQQHYRVAVNFLVPADSSEEADTLTGDLLKLGYNAMRSSGIDAPVELDRRVEEEPMKDLDTTIRLEFNGQRVVLPIEIEDDDIFERQRILAVDVEWPYGFAQPLIEAILQHAKQLTAGLSRERTHQLTKSLAELAANSLRETIMVEYMRRARGD